MKLLPAANVVKTKHPGGTTGCFAIAYKMNGCYDTINLATIAVTCS